MPKRKLEVADEESGIVKQSKIFKKQKTDTRTLKSKTLQSKAIPITLSHHTEEKRSLQAGHDRRKEKRARQLVKQETEASKDSQRSESGSKNGFKTIVNNGNTPSAETQIEKERLLQARQDRRKEKRARRLVKRETEASKDSQRSQSGFENGFKTIVDNGKTPLAETQTTKLPEKSRKGKGYESQHSKQEGGQESVGRGQSGKERRKDSTVGSNEKQGEKQSFQTASWKMSDSVGGQMLDMDPIFSPDEKFLLVAYSASIAVYSVSTSLPVRQLQGHSTDSISAFAISSTVQGHLYFSTLSGIIEKWDWLEGKRLNRWKTSSSIYSLVTAKQNPGDPHSDLVYTVDQKGQEPWLLSVHRLAGIGGAMTIVKALFTNEEALSLVKIVEQGRVIVATSGSQLILGSSDEPAITPLEEVSYKWRVIECPEYIVSIDVRIRAPEETQKMSKGSKLMVNSIDVVVGGLKGSIHIYEDLLQKVIGKDHGAGKGSSVDITSRRLHWHRNAVQAVKWSADGNYVISGGHETTLVLWQLETEQRQYLPHLGAAVESVVVSPFGSSYGIRLADNSAMILSTTELRPTFSIAGIQVPAVQQQRLPLPFIPTVNAATRKKGVDLSSRIPACASSSSPGSLLVAVPPATTSKQSSMTPAKASYLQTVDAGSAHQISRQALTRTKVTTLSMGPESNTIEEPNVRHIQTSSDGQWLVSVDEWIPPKRDLEPFAFNQARLLEETILREEIFLKFWSWDVDTKMWEVMSRIDNPHKSPSGIHYNRGDVLDLVSDPSSIAFATVGGDGIVKTWRPAIRRRNGLEVKSKDGRSLKTWYCQHVTPLEISDPATKAGLVGAKLAYSSDGSVLAVGLQSSMASPIYIINANSGEIQSVHTGLYAGPLNGLGIIHKYLVTLSDDLCVYDLVNEKLQYGIELPAHVSSPGKRSTRSQLAVNANDSNFAVAIPDTGKIRLESKIAVFDPTDATPQFLTHLTGVVTTLVSASGRKGFYTIDSAAQVRSIIPGRSIPLAPMVLPEDKVVPARGLNNLFGGDQRMFTEGDSGKDAGLTVTKAGSLTQAPDVKRDGPAVVSQDRLAEVFDVGPAYALPPITELFEQVAMLYCGKDRG